MSTFQLDTSGDLEIPLALLTDLVEETAQRLRTKFKFFLGEWHLDPRVGFPLLQRVLKKNPSVGEIRAYVQETLIGDPAVEFVNTIEIDFDTQLRKMTISFECELNDGSVLTFEDFILEANR